MTGSTLIPLLTLGIPGDVITAIMLGALTVHGLIPGPTLFQQQGDFVTALFIGMLMVTFLHLIVGYLACRCSSALCAFRRASFFRWWSCSA